MSEFKSYRSYWHFANRVKSHYRFVREHDEDQFLFALFESCSDREYTLKKDEAFWRAQLGYVEEDVCLNDEVIGEEPAPFSVERMKPLYGQAKEGRANPKGIPYLYGSNDKRVSVSEIRPWLGAHITLALFKIQKDLKLINFASNNKDLGPTIYFKEPSVPKREARVWNDIDRAFSVPITDSDSVADYVPTQIIAEYFKIKVYDGIMYRSSLGRGKNIAIFDLNSAEVIDRVLVQINKLEYDFDEVTNHRRTPRG